MTAGSARTGGSVAPAGWPGGAGVDEAVVAARVRERFIADGTSVTPASVVGAVRAEPGAALRGDAGLLRLADRVHGELAGAGPLSPLLADARVTDVLVNGTQVWVDRGAGLERAAVGVGSVDEVRRLAQRLAAACGRRLDDGCPYVDARLPDGTRLHAVLPPVAATGPYLSLRTFRQRPFQLAELVGNGMVDPPVAELLQAVVAGRLAYLIAGGTGSGKTTLLNTLLGLVPADERIVMVEDAAELRPEHPHVVTLQARTANVEGVGSVGLGALVRQALRMRPDRLVVGECRGAEVVDLLAALDAWRTAGVPGRLHFTSFEAFPMTPPDMRRAQSRFPDLAALAAELAPHWTGRGQRITLDDLDFTLIEGDARDTLSHWPHEANAWFLDGFSPAKNPELWQPALMAEVARHTAPGGTAATYTAAGFVRRGLEAAGFSVSRVPGYGRKRHMTRARLTGP